MSAISRGMGAASILTALVATGATVEESKVKELVGGPELARQLSFPIDLFLCIHPETLSAEPKGHADDGLPTYQDFLGRIEILKTAARHEPNAMIGIN